MNGYEVTVADVPFPRYFRNLQDAIKFGSNARGGACLYRNRILIAFWSSGGEVVLIDKRKSLRKAFDRNA